MHADVENHKSKWHMLYKFLTRDVIKLIEITPSDQKLSFLINHGYVKKFIIYNQNDLKLIDSLKMPNKTGQTWTKTKTAKNGFQWNKKWYPAM